MKTIGLAILIALSSSALAGAAGAERTITVSAKNFAFVPSTITLKANQRVKLHFVSKQGVHGIVIPEIGVTNVVNMGPSPVDVQVTPKKPGTYVARCAVYCGIGHGKMVLTVKVTK